MLKTIEEHNEERLHLHQNKNLTGVACPNCGEELQFHGRGIMLSSPAQREVKCYNCNYSGRIYE